MDELEDNISAEDIKYVDSPSFARIKPKKRSLVERELETNLTERVTSPITDGSSTSRYGRSRRLKIETEVSDSDKQLKGLKSPKIDKSPVKIQSPVYKMHASNSPIQKQSPKLDNSLENQIENIYNENISLSRFGDEKYVSPAKKYPKLYIRKDLIQTKDDDKDDIMLIKNMFSPLKSNQRSYMECSSEKKILNNSRKPNGYLSVVKTLDFDGNKKKKKDVPKLVISKSDLFHMEAQCEYQVGDLAWCRMGTYPFWPCIVTREPFSEMFVKKKLFGRVERDVIHVTFFGDNGRRGWIVDSMLRKFLGRVEFEATRDQFTPASKKKDPKYYAAFFVSEKKMPQWTVSVKEAEVLLREPKRLRIDLLNEMLIRSRLLKNSTPKTEKSKKIVRTNSDVSLSESLYDSLFSEDDSKTEERSKSKTKNKSFDVSEVVTACLDNMAAKTGIIKIQRQSHMDRWLQKAKSKTPEKSQLKSQITRKPEKEVITRTKKVIKETRSKKYSFRNSSYESQDEANRLQSHHNEHDYSSQSFDENSLLVSHDSMFSSQESAEEPGSGIGIISKVESLSDTSVNSGQDNILMTVEDDVIVIDGENEMCAEEIINNDNIIEETKKSERDATSEIEDISKKDDILHEMSLLETEKNNDTVNTYIERNNDVKKNTIISFDCDNLSNGESLKCTSLNTKDEICNKDIDDPNTKKCEYMSVDETILESTPECISVSQNIINSVAPEETAEDVTKRQDSNEKPITKEKINDVLNIEKPSEDHHCDYENKSSNKENSDANSVNIEDINTADEDTETESVCTMVTVKSKSDREDFLDNKFIFSGISDDDSQTSICSLIRPCSVILHRDKSKLMTSANGIQDYYNEIYKDCENKNNFTNNVESNINDNQTNQNQDVNIKDVSKSIADGCEEKNQLKVPNEDAVSNMKSVHENGHSDMGDQLDIIHDNSKHCDVNGKRGKRTRKINNTQENIKSDDVSLSNHVRKRSGKTEIIANTSESKSEEIIKQNGFHEKMDMDDNEVSISKSRSHKLRSASNSIHRYFKAKTNDERESKGEIKNKLRLKRNFSSVKKSEDSLDVNTIIRSERKLEDNGDLKRKTNTERILEEKKKTSCNRKINDGNEDNMDFKTNKDTDKELQVKTPIIKRIDDIVDKTDLIEKISLERLLDDKNVDSTNLNINNSSETKSIKDNEDYFVLKEGTTLESKLNNENEDDIDLKINTDIEKESNNIFAENANLVGKAPEIKLNCDIVDNTQFVEKISPERKLSCGTEDNTGLNVITSSENKLGSCLAWPQEQLNCVNNLKLKANISPESKLHDEAEHNINLRPKTGPENPFNDIDCADLREKTSPQIISNYEADGNTEVVKKHGADIQLKDKNKDCTDIEGNISSENKLDDANVNNIDSIRNTSAELKLSDESNDLKENTITEKKLNDENKSNFEGKTSPDNILNDENDDNIVLKERSTPIDMSHDDINDAVDPKRKTSTDRKLKDEIEDNASVTSDDSEALVYLTKRKPRVKTERNEKKNKVMEEPEFLKYLELRQDALIDEHPELSQEDINAYLYKTWLYEEGLKTDRKKTDDIEQANLVKGLNQEVVPVKKVRKKAKVEKEKELSVEPEVIPNEKSKRKISRPSYNEDWIDIEEDITYYEIFKTKKSMETSNDGLKSDNLPNTTETVNGHYEELQYEFDEIEAYFEQLTTPKPNVFKGLIREKVCEVCEKAGNLVKCKGCHSMFHYTCAKNKIAETEAPLPSRGRKKKKKNRGRKPKEGDSDHSDDKSQDANVSEEHNMSIEDEIEPNIVANADDFEAQLAIKMKELIENTDNIEYDSFTSDDELDWSDIDVGKCEVIDVKPRNKRTEMADCSNFKCHNCEKHDTPICFVCRSITSPNDKAEHRQKCQVAHCHRYYHLECLDHWPQTQFNSGQSSRSNKINEYFEPLTCPRHVCHTCVSDDPRGCKTRFSGDKLAKCVRCPATYHSFSKCLPAGSQILTGSHIICPRHYEHRPGKVPCHVNTGWCFICALGGSLICCEYCPTSFHAECLNIKPPEGGYMCEDCETGRLPLYGEMVWVKLGHYRWWPGIILHPCEIPDNIFAVKHSPGEFVVRFFGQYDHYWVNRGRVFPFQEGDSGKISSQKSKIDAAFTTAMEHAQRACEILKKAAPNEEESLDIASSLLPPHYVKLKVNKPCGSLCGRRVDVEESSLTQCECDPNDEEPCGPYSQCLNRMLLTECGPTCRAGERCHNRAFEKRLYPKLVPYRTPQRGWGLKTLEDIRAGQFVIEYVGELIDEEEFKRRMRRKHEIRDENFYFLTLDKERMIDAGPKGNLARFMNHCCEPNCETQKWTVLGDSRVGLFALYDIPANCEVTFNYNLECAGIDKKRCMCGAKRCSGYIGAKPKQDEPQPKKNKFAAKRTYKKRKTEESPSTTPKSKKKLGRPAKPKELTEIEKDLLIIKNATNSLSSDSECSGRLSSLDSVNGKALKRKRVEFSSDSVCNGSPSSKRSKTDEDKPSSEVGD